MKKWITNNMGIKLVSISFAFILWLIIININDPYKTKSFIVNVDVINEDAIKAANKVYEIVEGSTAQVTVSGNRSVVDSLKASDIGATADLSALSNVNAVAIKPHLNKSVSSEIELTCSQVLKVSLEDLETVQVKVAIETQGLPEDGYFVGECTAKPNMIEVSGGKSTISKIETVKVFLNVENVNSDIHEKLIPRVYDVAGNEVDSSRLKFSSEKIRVTAQVLEKKSVPVKLDIKGSPADGYVFAGVDCLPESVELAAAREVLNKITEIRIPIQLAGLTSTSADLERDVATTDYLPDGVTEDQVKVVETSETISIRINIETAVERMLTLTSGDIQVRNLPENYHLSYISGLAYAIPVYGTRENVNRITANELAAYIDCKNLGIGKHKIELQFAELNGIEIQRKVYVTIRIVKSEGTTQEGEESDPLASPEASASPAPEVSDTPAPEEAAQSDEDRE